LTESKINLKAILSMTKNTVTVYNIMQMGKKNTRVNLNIINAKAKEFFTMKMGQLTKDNFVTTCFRGLKANINM